MARYDDGVRSHKIVDVTIYLIVNEADGLCGFNLRQRPKLVSILTIEKAQLPII